MRNAFQFLACARRVRLHRLERVAVFSLQRPQQFSPFFHLFQPLRVELDRFTVGANLPFKLSGLIQNRLGVFPGPAHRRIDLRQLGKDACRLSEGFGRRARIFLLGVERRHGLIGQGGQLFGVGQAGAFLQQRGFFAGNDPRRIDLRNLIIQHIGAARGVPFSRSDLSEFFPDRPKHFHPQREFLAPIFQSGEPVQQPQMLARPKQGEVLGLSVHVHQQLAHIAQDRQVDRPSVHPDDVPSLAPDFPAERQRSSALP